MKSLYIFANNNRLKLSAPVFMKIGISKHPKKRAIALKRKFNLKDYALYFTKQTYSPGKLEKICHDILSKYSVGGECFIYDLKKAKKIINNIFNKRKLLLERKEKRMNKNINLIPILEKEMRLMGYTGSKLAKALKKSNPSSVTAWIRGDYKPSPKTVKKMRGLKFSVTACLFPARLVSIDE